MWMFLRFSLSVRLSLSASVLFLCTKTLFSSYMFDVLYVFTVNIETFVGGFRVENPDFHEKIVEIFYLMI